MILRYAIFLFFACSFAFASVAGPFGSFTGTFTVNSLGQNQLARLEIFPDHVVNGILNSKAILSLYLGDFSSREYLTYRFDSVVFDEKSQQFVFQLPSRELTFTSTQYNAPDDTIAIDVSSTYTEDPIGTLRLQKGTKAKHTANLIEPLWGEYRGECADGPMYLQLKTSRATSEIQGTENPFTAYRVKGALAEHDPENPFCRTDPPRPCVKEVFTTALYDFHTGRLKLDGDRPLKCKVSKDGITCDGCLYKRVSSEAAEPRKFEAPKETDPFPRAHSTRKSLAEIPAGNYIGYLHHERLDTYQPMKVLLSAPENSSGHLQRIVMATLFFGDYDNDENIPYRFDPLDASAPTMPVLLLREDGNSDALVLITDASDVEIHGMWYSALYGRIGTFAAKRKTGIPLPPNAHVTEEVGGHYLWSAQGVNGPLDFDIFIPVVKRDPPPFGTQFNAFFPLDFDTYDTNRQGQFPRNRFPGGSYDFFTGRISLGDALIGYLESRDKLFLLQPLPHVAGTPLGPNDPIQVPYLGPIS